MSRVEGSPGLVRLAKPRQFLSVSVVTTKTKGVTSYLLMIMRVHPLSSKNARPSYVAYTSKLYSVPDKQVLGSYNTRCNTALELW